MWLLACEKGAPPPSTPVSAARPAPAREPQQELCTRTVDKLQSQRTRAETCMACRRRMARWPRPDARTSFPHATMRSPRRVCLKECSNQPEAVTALAPVRWYEPEKRHVHPVQQTRHSQRPLKPELTHGIGHDNHKTQTRARAVHFSGLPAVVPPPGHANWSVWIVFSVRKLETSNDSGAVSPPDLLSSARTTRRHGRTLRTMSGSLVHNALWHLLAPPQHHIRVVT